MIEIIKLDLLLCVKRYLILLMLVLSACTTTMPEHVSEQQLIPVQGANNLTAEKAWYAVRFNIFWDKSIEPDWSLGTLIAGEVISPVMDRYQHSISCWRLHRRAVDDKTGHVLSFIFYSSEADAAIIYQQFKVNTLLAELKQQRLLVKIVYDPLSHNSQTKISDTSDPVWPEQIRGSWPYFIMGASHMWLEQIRAVKKEVLNEPDIQQRYVIIQSNISDLWQQQGQHALVHHLNALYAYQPFLTRF